MQLIVNLFGAPSSGKSTAAATIYAELKRRHVVCELVTDFAKDMIIQGNTVAMENQLYIWASQLFRNECAYKRATVTVTDTPILLGCIYNKPLTPALRTVMFDQHRAYNNFNLVVTPNYANEYSMHGRIHTQDQSMVIQQEIIALLTDHDISYTYYDDREIADICDTIQSIVE